MSCSCHTMVCSNGENQISIFNYKIWGKRAGLARTHGRISPAWLLNPRSEQEFPSEPRSLWRLGKFPARFDEKQSFAWVIFTSRAQGTSQIIGLLWGCWDNWAAGFRVPWSVWGGLRLSLLMPLSCPHGVFGFSLWRVSEGEKNKSQYVCYLTFEHQNLYRKAELLLPVSWQNVWTSLSSRRGFKCLWCPFLYLQPLGQVLVLGRCFGILKEAQGHCFVPVWLNASKGFQDALPKHFSFFFFWF